MSNASSVSAVTFSEYVKGSSGDKPSVALHDKLAKCERQLGDWKACPSSKTPEGKKIIENLQSQIRTIQSRISSSENDPSENLSTKSLDSNLQKVENANRRTSISTVGQLVNTFA
jgi:hypothetical protein